MVLKALEKFRNTILIQMRVGLVYELEDSILHTNHCPERKLEGVLRPGGVEGETLQALHQM